MVEMPKYAPLVIVTFMGACAGLLLMGLVFLYGLVVHKRWLIRTAAAVAVSGILLYGTLLFGFSLTSTDQVLAIGAQKHFCEVDCHVAYSVTAVTSTSELGSGTNRTPATGTFYVVRVQTWFDPATISPRRGNAPLTPSPRNVEVVDDSGTLYGPSQPGQRAFELTPSASTTPLTTALHPGESYSTDIVFDLPAGVRQPRLLIGDTDPMASLLIGHENSPMHKKIYFALSLAASPSSARTAP
jgi:hypothetical protein